MTELAPSSAARRRMSPLGALRQRWRLGVVVTVVGFLVGVLIGGTQSASYTAEARVGVGTGSQAATAVAGYSLGAEEIAADYARSVTTDDAKTTLAKTIGNVSGISGVNASPLPDSAVIRVDVSANSSSLALQAVGDVTSNFVSTINAQVTGTSAPSVLADYNALEQQLVPLLTTQTNQRSALARAQADGTSVAVTSAEQALTATTLKVNNLTAQASAQLAKYQTLVSQPQTENGLRPVQSAYLVGSNRHSLLERWGLIGLVLGALLALALAAWADNRQVRRRQLRTAGASSVGPSGAPASVVPSAAAVSATRSNVVAKPAIAEPAAAAPELVVPAEGDLTLVSLADGDAPPPPVLELEQPEPDELDEPVVDPAQLAVLAEPDDTDPGTAPDAAADEPEIPTAPEPAAYDLDDLDGTEREPVTVPDAKPKRRATRRKGPTDW